MIFFFLINCRFSFITTHLLFFIFKLGTAVLLYLPAETTAAFISPQTTVDFYFFSDTAVFIFPQTTSFPVIHLHTRIVVMFFPKQRLNFIYLHKSASYCTYTGNGCLLFPQKVRLLIISPRQRLYCSSTQATNICISSQTMAYLIYHQ